MKDASLLINASRDLPIYQHILCFSPFENSILFCCHHHSSLYHSTAGHRPLPSISTHFYALPLISSFDANVSHTYFLTPSGKRLSLGSILDQLFPSVTLSLPLGSFWISNFPVYLSFCPPAIFSPTCD